MDKTLLDECCKALGWQGGTIHQVIEVLRQAKEKGGKMKPVFELTENSRLKIEVTERILRSLIVWANKRSVTPTELTNFAIDMTNSIFGNALELKKD